jgi:hypothetical protein
VKSHGLSDPLRAGAIFLRALAKKCGAVDEPATLAANPRKFSFKAARYARRHALPFANVTFGRKTKAGTRLTFRQIARLPLWVEAV